MDTLLVSIKFGINELRNPYLAWIKCDVNVTFEIVEELVSVGLEMKYLIMLQYLGFLFYKVKRISTPTISKGSKNLKVLQQLQAVAVIIELMENTQQSHKYCTALRRDWSQSKSVAV